MLRRWVGNLSLMLGGLVAGVLGLTEAALPHPRDTRGVRNVQHPVVPLLRQSVYSRLAGYEDTSDAERLARDPAMQVVVGRHALERRAACTNTLTRAVYPGPQLGGIS